MNPPKMNEHSAHHIDYISDIIQRTNDGLYTENEALLLIKRHAEEKITWLVAEGQKTISLLGGDVK